MSRLVQQWWLGGRGGGGGRCSKSDKNVKSNVFSDYAKIYIFSKVSISLWKHESCLKRYIFWRLFNTGNRIYNLLLPFMKNIRVKIKDGARPHQRFLKRFIIN